MNNQILTIRMKNNFIFAKFKEFNATSNIDDCYHDANYMKKRYSPLYSDHRHKMYDI